MGANSAVAIAATAVLLVAYQLAANAPPVAAIAHAAARIVARRMIGFVVLGGGALAASLLFLPLSLEQLGLTARMPAGTWLWALGAAIVVAPLSLVIGRRPESYEAYPEIRRAEWDAGLVAVNLLSCVVYLFAYEFLFRGFLLFACLSEMAVVPAIAVNVLLYGLAHLPKGRSEALASLPFGVVLCLASIDTESFWAAFLIHVLLSQANDYAAVAANPESRFVRRRPSP